MKKYQKNILLFAFVIIVISCTSLDNNKMKEQNTKELNNDSSETGNKKNKNFISDTNIALNRGVSVYKDLIDKYKTELARDGKVSKSSILQCFPRNQDEYLYYYSLSTKDNKTFEKIENDLYQLADFDYDNAFFLYLSMIDFVDGEYADFVLQNIDILISKKTKKICLVYDKLSEHTKEVIDSYYAKYCK